MFELQSVLFLVILLVGGVCGQFVGPASSCEECLRGGKVFTPQGCQSSCLMDTWCYTTSCPILQDISGCDQCHEFGGQFKVGEGCQNLSFSCMMDSECYAPNEGCPDPSNISACEACVSSGGYFTGPNADEEYKNICLSSCVYFLPCITQCQ